MRLRPEEIEQIRQKAYKRWRKKYHPYIDKAIESTNLYVSEIPINGLWFPPRKNVQKECFELVKQDVDAIMPKTGIFSFIFLAVVSGIISWIVQRFLDKHYGVDT